MSIMGDIPHMVTVKADDRSRVKLPDIKPGQIFACEQAGEGQYLLTMVVKKEPESGKVKFIKKNGYTVGHTNKKVSLETTKEILSEFP